MKIMPNRMDRGFFQYQDEFENKALEVLRSGWYVLGKEVSSFEEMSNISKSLIEKLINIFVSVSKHSSMISIGCHTSDTKKNQ